MPKLYYIYPEVLPSPKARTTTVVESLAALHGLFEATLITVAESAPTSEIEKAYGVDLSGVTVVRLPKTFLGVRSNKIFNFHLLRALPKDEKIIIGVRHLKAARELLRHHQPNWHIAFECHEIFCRTAPTPQKARKLRALEEFVYAHADSLAFISEPLQAEVRESFAHLAARQFLAPTGAKVPVERPQKDFSVIDEVYYVGGLQEWKGVQVLLEAFARVPTAARLKIVGGGEPGRRDALERLAQALGVRERVDFVGQLSHAEVAQILSHQSKLCVLPNIPGPWERYSMPLKMFEYIGGGNIVVYSELPTLKILQAHGDIGLPVPPGDAAALAAAIESVLTAPAEYAQLAESAFKVAEHFTWDARAQKFAEFIEDGQKEGSGLA